MSKIEETIKIYEKQVKYSYVVFGILVVFSFLKFLGLFTVGTFPWYFEAGLALLVLVTGIAKKNKLKSLKENM